MSQDIDNALQRLADDQVPTGLMSIESVVLERVSEHRFSPAGQYTTLRVFAVAGALLMGVAGGLMPTDEAEAQPSLTPVAGASDLAPSSLLLGRL
jgi:hypothetical protein